MFDLQYIPPKYYNFYRQIPQDHNHNQKYYSEFNTTIFYVYSDQNDCAETQTING